MKLFIFASTLLVVSSAAPSEIASTGPVVQSGVPVLAPIVAVPSFGKVSSQYHSQDGLGHYAYGYSNDLVAKNEIRSVDGSTVGAYSFIDAEGKIQNVQYRSDDVHGFRVAASNLPVAPAPIEAPKVELPKPVEDTPEVVAARSHHLAALKEAEEKASKPVETKTEVISTPAVVNAIQYSAPAAVLRTSAVPYNIIAPSAYIASPLAATPLFGYNFRTFHAFQPSFYHYQPLAATYHSPIFARAIVEPRHSTETVVARSAEPEKISINSAESEQTVTKSVNPEPEPVVAVSEQSSPNENQVVSESQSRSADPVPVPVLPVAPEETPEVIKARAEHLAEVEKIKMEMTNE